MSKITLPIHMKHYIIYILLLSMLSSCHSGVKIDVQGRLVENAASMVYLVVQNNAIDTLASAEVAADNTFHLKTKVDFPTTAFLCDDNGNALTILLTEPSELRLRPLADGGYIAEGGPINDKYNLIMVRLSDLARQVSAIDAESENAQEEYESLSANYMQTLSTGVSDNLDNIAGVELFISQESRSMNAEDMRVRFNQFSPEMQNLPAMRKLSEYIDAYSRSEVGNQFIDFELENITGDKINLSDICGKGRWVLLDFWATWCAPCLETMPALQEMYQKYALQGFEIVGISLDRNPDRWREYITLNKILWTNILDKPYEDKNSASAQYGVQMIPCNFVISPDGEIVARDLTIDELRHKLEEIFGN